MEIHPEKIFMVKFSGTMLETETIGKTMLPWTVYVRAETGDEAIQKAGDLWETKWHGNRELMQITQVKGILLDFMY